MIIVLGNPNPKLQSVSIAESIRNQGCQLLDFAWYAWQSRSWDLI